MTISHRRFLVSMSASLSHCLASRRGAKHGAPFNEKKEKHKIKKKSFILECPSLSFKFV